MGRRWIHRRGAIFDATLRLAANPEAEQPAVVRISNTFGWPSPLPDWVGMGLRVYASADDGADLDVLMVSSAPVGKLWRQMRRNRDALACTFSSVVRYPMDGRDRIVAAVPHETRSASLADLVNGSDTCACPISYRIDVAEARGGWHPLGDLVLTARHPRDDRVTRFAPPRRGSRFLTPLRQAIYRLAQR